MMLRANVMFLLTLAVVLVIAFDPQTRAQAISMWDQIMPTLVEIKDDLNVLIHQITQSTTELPEKPPPPIDDGPVFNTYLEELWRSF